ncbi:Olfactory receptor, insect [Cinara cedri]|uniref:Odorant receptor n=1 Tax=Cinara cedri TaxID=506608 RepID=A0A5E4MAU2_9HEMI|nr:Olfactory receptor, insect [Cinara cedri]
METLKTVKETEYLFSLTLVKLISLYQILDPNTVRVCGHNAYHLFVLSSCLYISAICVICPMGLYYLSNDVTAFSFYFGAIENFLLVVLKMITIVYYFEDLRKCVEVARFGFLSSYQYYKKHMFKRWKKLFMLVSFTYVSMAFSASVVWILSTRMLNKTKIKIKNVDDSYSEYRINMYNLYLIVTDHTYNEHYNVFYAIEIVVLVSFIYFQVLFDLLLIIICFGLSCQLETICDAVETLGYSQYPFESNSDMGNNAMNLKNNRLHDDLKNIINDHQSVIKIINDFYNIFRVIILPQIFVNSSTHVLIWFIASMNFSSGSGISILFIKMITILPVFTFQLLMTCYLFGTINEKKESIIFALYSSDWVKMDAECKRLILFAMRINKTNQFKIKFTQTKIINMELFTSVRTSVN